MLYIISLIQIWVIRILLRIWIINVGFQRSILDIRSVEMWL